MDSQAIALLIAAGGLVLGLARLVVAILSYRLDSDRNNKSGHNTSSDANLHETLSTSNTTASDANLHEALSTSSPTSSDANST